MCRLISFLHRPDNGDIAVYDLTSHSATQKKLNLSEPLWCEGHYLVNGEIVCRVMDKNRKTTIKAQVVNPAMIPLLRGLGFRKDDESNEEDNEFFLRRK